MTATYPWLRPMRGCGIPITRAFCTGNDKAVRYESRAKPAAAEISPQRSESLAKLSRTLNCGLFNAVISDCSSSSIIADPHPMGEARFPGRDDGVLDERNLGLARSQEESPPNTYAGFADSESERVPRESVYRSGSPSTQAMDSCTMEWGPQRQCSLTCRC